MRVMVHCPALYEEATSNSRARGALIYLLVRTIENPWILANDEKVAIDIIQKARQWIDEGDRGKVQHLFKRLSALNRLVPVPVDEEVREPVLRAHDMAKDYELVEVSDRHHYALQGLLKRQPTYIVTVETLLEEGVDAAWISEGVLPSRNTRWDDFSSDRFVDEVWKRMFQWSSSLRIIDRNLTTYWIDKNGKSTHYQSSLQWIIESFARWQPGGRVTIDLVKGGKEDNKRSIRRWCEERADESGVVIDLVDTLENDFHDRYFYTQQGWWRCHRGVDMRKRERGKWVMRRDVEIVWQSYEPRGFFDKRDEPMDNSR